MGMSDHDAEMARLRRALASDNRQERAQAVVEAGDSNAQEMRTELQELLGDPDDLVAISAMFACWRLGHEHVPIQRAVAALASPDEETVMAAVHALGEMGAAAVPKLVELLDTDSQHACHVVRILGDIGGQRSLEAVQKAAASANAELADAARAVLDDWED
jgi:HEAT repeat protein